MTFGEINTAVISDSLTEDELRRIVRSATSRLRTILNQKGLAIAGGLRLGMKVGFGNKADPGLSRRSYKEGKIVAVNKTRAVVLSDGVRWTVPFTMLEVLAKNRKEVSA
jgi:hypothetical protein